MTDRKPRARSGGRRPRAKGGSPQRTSQRESNKASDSRARIKARLQALEARYSTLESQVLEMMHYIKGVAQSGPEWLQDDPQK